MPIDTPAQPGMRVRRSMPLGIRDSGRSRGQGRSLGRPTANRAMLMATNTPTRPQNGVHEASEEPPRDPDGADWVRAASMVTMGNTYPVPPQRAIGHGLGDR